MEASGRLEIAAGTKDELGGFKTVGALLKQSLKIQVVGIEMEETSGSIGMGGGALLRAALWRRVGAPDSGSLWVGWVGVGCPRVDFQLLP